MVERYLAPRPVSERPRRASPEANEFLVFVLAKEHYALELSYVREIVSPPSLTEVPRSPKDLLGVCSVRGLLVTVVDLRKRLGLPSAKLARGARILISQRENGEHIGLMVDEVKQVVKLGPKDVEIVHDVMGDLSSSILGVARITSDVVVVLDARKVTA